MPATAACCTASRSATRWLDPRGLQHRPLGRSGLTVAPFCLGGNVFGWTADEATSFAVLDAFVAGGGTMIDTADVYSAWVSGHAGGESESAIGEWLKASGKRDQVLLATKVGMLPGEGGEKLAPARIVAACEASLRRLGVEPMDLYYAHQDDEAIPQEAYLEAFARLVDQGKEDGELHRRHVKLGRLLGEHGHRHLVRAPDQVARRLLEVEALGHARQCTDCLACK